MLRSTCPSDVQSQAETRKESAWKFRMAEWLEYGDTAKTMPIDSYELATKKAQSTGTSPG